MRSAAYAIRKSAERLMEAEDFPEDCPEGIKDAEEVRHFYETEFMAAVFEDVLFAYVPQSNEALEVLPYFRNRLFPEMEFYQVNYPFFYRHKWLLPAAWVYRLGKALIFRRK